MPHLQIAIALIWRENRVLVARRYDDAEHLPGVWEFPGGKCEDGEAPRECAIREAREELGVEIEILSERESIDYDYPARRVRLYLFDAGIIAGEPCAQGCAEVFWLWPHELEAEKFPPANASLIAQLRHEF